MLALGCLVLGERNRARLAVMAGAGILAWLPYLVFIPSRTGSGMPQSVLSVLDAGRMLDLLGRLFVNGTGMNIGPMQAARIIGVLGVSLGIVGAGLAVAQAGQRLPRWAMPSLLLMAFGLGGSWLVTMFRRGIAPWYLSMSSMFWIGLLGLVYALCVQSFLARAAGTPQRMVNTLALIWGGLVAVLLAGRYAVSNVRYEDKSFYLASRSPASAACLRHYRDGPTYCEQLVFQWGTGFPALLARLGEPLERNRLSVFAPRQRWTLQGDYVLPSVRTHEAPGAPDIYWTANPLDESLILRLGQMLRPVPEQPARLAWSHFKRLDLNLHPSNSVSWSMAIPAETQQAWLRSAVRVNSNSTAPAGGGLRFEVRLETAPNRFDDVYTQSVPAGERRWQTFSVDLSSYAGQTITLWLETRDEGAGPGYWGVFRHPYVDVALAANYPVSHAGEVRPANTDLSPYLPAITPDDAIFDTADPSLWQFSPGMRPSPQDGEAVWIIGDDPFMDYDGPVSNCLSEYTHLYLQVAVTADVARRTSTVLYKTSAEPDDWATLEIPLLAGGEMHTYAYDLKLLELDRGVRLTDIRLDPVAAGGGSGESEVRIADFRLVRAGPSGACDAS
jgi:hypothetical protein